MKKGPSKALFLFIIFLKFNSFGNFLTIWTIVGYPESFISQM